MMMPNRTFSSNSYRYGFNGKENDNEVKGEGNQQDYGMRVYDPRSGRFLSVDPLSKSYPMLTPYQYASNSPIACVDIDGLEGSPFQMMRNQQSIREYEAKLRTTDPEHANQIILMHNVNAFLLVGTSLSAGAGIESFGLKPLLTNMSKSGVVGAGVNSLIAYAQGGDKYAIVKSAISGFFSGAALGGIGGKSLTSILAAGGVSGGVGEIVNQVFDNKFGNDKGYDLKSIIESAGIGAVANFLSSTIIDKLSQAIDKQLIRSVAATETSSYREIIKKAILERSPRIGTQQLKRAVNQEVKSVQQLLTKEAEANKVASTQAIERSTDYNQDATNNAVKSNDEKKK